MAKAKKPPYAKGRKRCIFCEKYGVTKEHVFADWLKEIFPHAPNATHTYGEMDWRGNVGPGGRPTIKTQKKQGHVGTRKIREVCDGCNGGWMSKLEERAKPFLIPMIGGRSGFITNEIKLTLATWAAKTAMTAERVHPRESGISQTERAYLMNKQMPPPGWVVWIAAYGGIRWRNLSIYQHRGWLNDAPVVGRRPGSNYAQATTFGLGHILFSVVSSSWAHTEDAFRGREPRGLPQIWPPGGSLNMWPPARVLLDPEANAVSNVLVLSGVFNNALNPQADWTFTF